MLGTGDALITGGETGAGVTASAEVFLYHTYTFTPTIPMGTARAEHSSTGTSCGPIVLIGGRSGLASNFLSTLEMYTYDNMNPVVAIPSRHRTGRPNGAVCDVGPGVLPAERARRFFCRGCCPGVDDGGFDRLAPQEASQIVFIRQRLAG